LGKIIEPLRGVHDVLPAQAAAWQHLERITREVFAGYGYEEFRVPVIEQTQLFKRSIGDFTDIVEKEMFSFVDQGEDHITLRPEATAGIVRAVISNGLLRENRLRVWCMGPMFRRERPQAGRYRQFHQIDAEAFGFAGPDIDAELILLSARLLRRLGLARLKLIVNSLGTPASRAAYRDQLAAYFGAHEAALDEDSKRRLHGNPLRILDSKNPDMQRIVAGAPLLLESLDAESKAHFESLCSHLKSAGIEYHVEPHLVRGLDYYTRTVFEWTTDALRDRPDVYLVLVGEGTEIPGFRLAEKLRDAWPALKLQINLGRGSFKTQFKRADKSGAKFAVVLGDDEVARGVVALKDLRRDVAQEECAVERINERLGVLLGLKAGIAE
jgi:histidyl-tRNA synthetase